MTKRLLLALLAAIFSMAGCHALNRISVKDGGYSRNNQVNIQKIQEDMHDGLKHPWYNKNATSNAGNGYPAKIIWLRSGRSDNWKSITLP